MKNLNIKEVAHKVLKIFVWAISILVILFAILTIARIPHYLQVQKTNDQVVKIHNTKLSIDDVMGINLPSDPGVEADKTIQGIDANNNGIRDDVELAIFKEYPNSAKTRAVLLQYALALQMETVQPFVNTVIATEVVREQSRAFVCIGDAVSKKDLEKFGKETDNLTFFVKNSVFNTEERKTSKNIFVKQVRSYAPLEQKCDIDLLNLSN